MTTATRRMGRRLSPSWYRGVLIAPGGGLAKVPGEEIDEDAHFRRQMPAMGIDRVDRQFSSLEPGQDRDETTGGEIVGHQEPRGIHQALARQRRRPQRLAAVSLEIAR